VLPPWEGVLGNDDIGVQVLQQAVEVIGGSSALADRLHLSQRKLEDWLHRREPIPWQISLIAAEIVVPALLTTLFSGTALSQANVVQGACELHQLAVRHGGITSHPSLKQR